MPDILVCIQAGCGRCGDDIGNCGAVPVGQGGTCPNEGRPVVPGKDVIITNETKGVTRVVSAQEIARGKAATMYGTDLTDEVTAKVVPVSVKKQDPKRVFKGEADKAGGSEEG